MKTLAVRLLSLFAWREVWTTGVWSYQHNAVTGARRAICVGDGYQPLDQSWLNTGVTQKLRDAHEFYVSNYKA
jgi:hypothetical protein